MASRQTVRLACEDRERSAELPRQRSHTDTFILQPPSVNRSISAPAYANRLENEGDLIWCKYEKLFPEESFKYYCRVSACIASRITSTRGSYHQSSGYNKFHVFLTNYSVHFIRQRKGVLHASLEVYRSFSMASVQSIELPEEDARLTLVFEKNEVKLRFVEYEKATYAREQFKSVHDECERQLSQERRAKQLSSFGSLSAEFTSTLTGVNNGMTERVEEGVTGSQLSIFERTLITLKIRPRPVYQPVINQKNEQTVMKVSRWKQLESERAVIKYPSLDSTFALPTECYLRMDNSHVVLMWKYPTEKHYSLSKCITFDHIYEVREGQQTEAFRKFPYEKVSEQSFSIIFEEERKVVNLFGSHNYTMLRSMDIVCEDESDIRQWTEAVEECHFNTKKQLFPKNLKFSDHTLIWLKVYFSVYANACYNEISQEKTLRFLKSLDCTLHADVPAWYVSSRSSQMHDTVLNDTLNWYGFVSVYDMYIVKQSKVLHGLFCEYAKEQHELGMTVEEFRDFLMSHKNWPAERCSDRKCRKMMDLYDKNHRVYKEIMARKFGKNTPLQMSLRLSFPGFLSFLRGKDNQIVNREHEEIYQDMDQPLSHYFINSSHNTYLSGHQIRGESSYEAYIRPLLNGCRCLEIDCWDDGKDIIVTHGKTPTSRVSFNKVLETIKEYAFVASEFPVILSLENHCSKENRKRMAGLLQSTFGSCGYLVTEDLDTWQGRSALPSPNALKRKIIIKDSFKYHSSGKGSTSPVSSLDSELPQLTVSPDQNLDTVTSYVNPMGNIDTCPLDPTSDDDIREIDMAENKLTKKPATYHFSPKSNAQEVQSCVVHLFQEDEKIKTTTLAACPLPDSYSSSNSPPICEGEELPGWRLNYLVLRGTALQEYKDRLDQRDDDDYVYEKEMAGELTDMVYLRSQKIKSENLWDVISHLRPSEMLSFQETKGISRSRDNPQAILNFTRKSLLRVYPKGSRIKSENYDPIIYWNYGMQLVALNYQTSDVFMNINQGKFRQNGNCGYVLKPDVLRKMTTETGLPEPHFWTSSNSATSVTIRLVGGQNMGPLACNVMSFKIWFLFCGCIEDTSYTLEYFRAANSQVRPLFEGNSEQVRFFECSDDVSFSREIIVPELCLFYARVEIQERGGIGQRPSPKLLGQNTIPLESLTQGVTFLPLRQSSGQLIHGSGLFVDITKKSRESPRVHRLERQHRSEEPMMEPMMEPMIEVVHRNIDTP